LALFGIAAIILFTPVFAEDNFIETRLIEKGSFVYGSAYQSLAQTDDFDEGFGGEDELGASIIIQDNAFLASANLYGLATVAGIFDKSRSGIVTYEVQSGDTPSYIAASFGISTNTLLWTNNLNYWSTIQPGQKLVILPISGVLHEVKKGENLAAIVKNYKGNLDETIAYNGLPADGTISVGQKIIIPGGSKVIVSPSTYASVRPNTSFTGPYSGISHKFPWGQCTWYVAQKRYVPWTGHAKSWLSNAQQLGFSVCRGNQCDPVVGAIVSTNETRYGHVAYVEAVQGDSIIISEMSLGKGILKTRSLKINDKRIRGYIY
jgi:surface antigen